MSTRSSAPTGAVDPKKLFVGNLSWSITSEDLKSIFEEVHAGENLVVEAFVLTDKFSGRSKGFGFVTMATPEAAEQAIQALNGKDVDGRELVVNVAQPPKPREEWGNRGGSDRYDRRSSYNNDRRPSGGNFRRGR